MKAIKIKRELLPTRCEICHQMDQYNAVNNYCARCKGLLATPRYYTDYPVITIYENLPAAPADTGRLAAINRVLENFVGALINRGITIALGVALSMALITLIAFLRDPDTLIRVALLLLFIFVGCAIWAIICLIPIAVIGLVIVGCYKLIRF